MEDANELNKRASDFIKYALEAFKKSPDYKPEHEDLFIEICHDVFQRKLTELE